MTLRASRPDTRQKRGFTAVEIAMVASVIAILALLILPIFRQRAEEARIAAAQDELQSLVKALLLVEADIPGGNHLPQLSDLNNLEAGPNANLTGTAPDPSQPGRTRWFNDPVNPQASRFVFAGEIPAFYPQASYQNTVAPNWKGPYIAMRNTMPLGQLLAQFPELTAGNGGTIRTQGFDVYPLDPWGSPYILFGPEGETAYNYRVIYSLGPDGLPGGTAQRAGFGGGLPANAFRRQGGLLGTGDDLEFRF
ncbi:MAG: type II secretion system protein GspG [Candidatus Sumerlaeia bacterium]|nr:type II secretion system protein GspG [Candidatus Sumerlaeia bacterium]